MKNVRTFLVALSVVVIVGSCAEKVDEVVPDPEFHLELTPELHFEIECSNEITSLSICVSEEDAEYLDSHYVMSFEEVSGNIELITWGTVSDAGGNVLTYIPVESLDSKESELKDVNQFKSDMMDNGYSVYSSFYIRIEEFHKHYRCIPFRLKLYFPETGETYYTKEYTLIIYWEEDGYLYSLVPGKRAYY